MRPLVKVGLVGAGYIGAFALASAVVTAYVAATSGPDRQNYGAMFAFGDDLLFLGVFGVAAVVPSGAALFFLRPYRSFWRVLSVTALVVATTAVAAFFDDLAWRGSDVLYEREHREACGLDARPHLDDGLEHERGEYMRRLGQQDQRWRGHQGTADGEHLQLRAREVGPEPAPQHSQPRKARKHVVDGPRPRAAPDDLEVFLGALSVEKIPRCAGT